MPRDLCYRAHNLASERDIVHLGKIVHSFVFRGAEKTFEAIRHHKELILLKPHPDAPLFDHSWQSPTFEKQIKFIIQEYKECNGEYNEEK